MHSDPAAGVLWPRVIGQDRVKRLLLTARRQNRLAHAYLLHGPEGTGKDALALELARVLHCERGGDEACDACGSCARMATLQHPDVRLVTALPTGKGEQGEDSPTAKLASDDLEAVRAEYRAKAADPYHRVLVPRSTIIKISSIREVRREAPMGTSDGKRRVFIISRAEDMGDEAANTLLKTLEEPAGNSLLLLTSARPHALLPTIRSRCQQIACDPLTDEQIARALEERRGVPAEQARLTARLAAGSYGHALELLTEDLAQERAEVVSYVRQSLAGHAAEVGRYLDAFEGGKDRDAARRFLGLLLLWFRDALVLARGGAVINVDQTEDLRRFVERVGAERLPEVILAVERAVFLVDRNVYLKLIFWELTVLLRGMLLRTP